MFIKAQNISRKQVAVSYIALNMDKGEHLIEDTILRYFFYRNSSMTWDQQCNFSTIHTFVFTKQNLAASI